MAFKTRNFLPITHFERFLKMGVAGGYLDKIEIRDDLIGANIKCLKQGLDEQCILPNNGKNHVK